MARFAGKTVVITGGNSGIGLGAARRFAAEGARVVIIGRNPATLATARDELGPDALAFQADLGSICEVRRVAEWLTTNVGQVDVLFANAGVSAVAPFDTVSEDSWDRLMDVNLKGVFFLIQGLVPLMARGGAIVVCGSMVAVRAFPGGSVYCAAKAALRSLTGVLAHELGALGIRINTLTPGFIDTPIYRRTDGLPPAMAADLATAAVAATPLRRAGTPDDCAAAVLYLASDDAGFVTGAEIVVDGGTVGPV